MSTYTLLSSLHRENIDEPSHEKLIEEYSLRIGARDKASLDKMHGNIKAHLNQEIRLLIKFFIHLSKFDPDKREE